ncbi:MAG: hypothetical protein K2N06_05475 [Oscillospiraceae bacterium]|nr:hypothetical protein [Oscillospiraceae bacterium]
MAAKENLTKAADITVKAREIDFVTRFTDDWTALREIMGIMRPIKKAPGTKLTSYTASVTLADGAVAEGDEIPYSKATVTPVSYADLTLEKYCKAVSIEAVNQYGAEVAVEKTDNAFLKELQSKVMTSFYDFVKTGTLTSTESTFQMAVAMAIGKVKDKFKKLHKNASNTVLFVNTLDVYRYLGSANITVQTSNGIDYMKNFMGASTVILSSELPEGKVIAVPADNIVLYYSDPSDSDFRKLGLQFTTQGETNLIGFHAEGDYKHAVGECYAIMGMVLWAEYLDAIAVVTISGAGSNTPPNDDDKNDQGGGVETQSLKTAAAKSTTK